MGRVGWRQGAVLAASWSFCASAACVDPLVDDAVSRPELILPAGGEVPEEADDPILLAQIVAADGVEGPLVRQSSAFWNGAPVRYWDFGAASPVAIPLYMLVREVEGTGDFEADGRAYSGLPDHYPIFDKVPGDPGYSPWWTVVLVPVTDDYEGQLLTSFEAVDEARRQGLVGDPIPLTMTINCPVVAPGIRLERVVGAAPETSSGAYYHGVEVHYFSFDVVMLHGPAIATAPVYTLRREGGEPLSEARRGVDMTGDGDRVDSNDIFVAAPGEEAYTGMVQRVDVVVTPATSSIDTSGDETMAELTSQSDLFTGGGDDVAPDPQHVIAIYPTSEVMNWPIVPIPPAPVPAER